MIMVVMVMMMDYRERLGLEVTRGGCEGISSCVAATAAAAIAAAGGGDEGRK
jgi:hypothetical protein